MPLDAEMRDARIGAFVALAIASPCPMHGVRTSGLPTFPKLLTLDETCHGF
jgi:hypothetical protein